MSYKEPHLEPHERRLTNLARVVDDHKTSPGGMGRAVLVKDKAVPAPARTEWAGEAEKKDGQG